jgi:hypothetical protein
MLESSKKFVSKDSYRYGIDMCMCMCMYVCACVCMCVCVCVCVCLCVFAEDAMVHSLPGSAPTRAADEVPQSFCLASGSRTESAYLRSWSIPC